MNKNNKYKLISFFLATVLCGSVCGAFSAVSATGAEAELIVNDNDTGTENFKFNYTGNWVHEGGYPDRFYGGDEHWTTSAQFGSSYPAAELRFVGSQVSIYGHKVSAGAMADVSIDGDVVDRIDLYNSSRVEKVLLFKSEKLPYGEHIIKIQLVEEQNKASTGTHEASIDYAVVTTSEAIPVTGIKLNAASLTLEPEMKYPLKYTLLPVYATETPVVSFKSSDGSVASVNENGIVTAVSEGSAVITSEAGDGPIKASVTVNVRKAEKGSFTGVVGDTNVHTLISDYYNLFEKTPSSDTDGLYSVAYRSDTVTSKLDILSKGKDVSGLTVTCGQFKTAEGKTVDAVAELSFIDNTIAHDTGHSIPDVISGKTKYNLSASSVVSVWISVKTPKDAVPGVYTADITVKADDGTTLIFPYTLEVLSLTLPENSANLELWQYPYSSNRYYSGKTTKEYFGKSTTEIYLDDKYESALISQLELYKSRGGNTVTVTIVEDPWNSQTPDPYPSMIKWTQKEDGTFSFDYTDFDKWVALNEKCGITGNIMSFSISDWANNITYKDIKTGKVKSETLTPGSKRWVSVWTEFLEDYMVHTTEKGIFDRVYMSMDERGADVVEAVLDIVESVKNSEGKCFKTSLAVFTFDTEYMFDRVTSLSLAYALPLDKLTSISEHRRSIGLQTTIYTCGGQNSALENQPYESLYCMWYSLRCGTDGFLRWAYDAFNDEPLVTSEHRLFAAGDIYLIYPDIKTAEEPEASTSARFEKLAEGCRLITKTEMLKEQYPEYAETVDKLAASLGKRNGGDMKKECMRMETELNFISREASLKNQIAEVQALYGDVLAEDIKAAQNVLASAHTDEQLTSSSCALSAAVEKLKDETSAEPDTSFDSTTEAPAAEKPIKDNKPLYIALGIAAAVVIGGIVYAIVRGKKRK